MSPHVLVLYNQPILPADDPAAASEQEIEEIAAVVVDELRQAEFRVSSLALAYHPDPLMELVRSDRPDAVFNLFEGFSDGRPAEVYPLAILEWLGIPCTGNGIESLVWCRDKPRAKCLLRGAGFPTPRFCTIEAEGTVEWEHGWPAFVKPARQDASIGIDQGSVVTDRGLLVKRVGELFRRYGPPILVEEYLDGREFNVAIIADPLPRALPVSEIVFHHRDQVRWPIVTYDAKWAEGSLEDRATRPQCPAELTADQRRELSRLALAAAELFGCRDFVRVDIRTDAVGRPFILELNPNPGYHPDAGFSTALRAAGLTHAQYTVSLIERALAARRPREIGPRDRYCSES